MKPLATFSAAALTLAIGAAALADGHAQTPPSVKARQGQMQLIALNIGVVGGMARGNVEYDAAAAQEAADNLVAISNIGLMHLWPDGTSADDIDGTVAKATIWSDRAGFEQAWADYGAGAEGLQAVAGDGLEALQGAIGGLGRSCGSCHDNYRVPRN